MCEYAMTSPASVKKHIARLIRLEGTPCILCVSNYLITSEMRAKNKANKMQN